MSVLAFVNRSEGRHFVAHSHSYTIVDLLVRVVNTMGLTLGQRGFHLPIFFLSFELCCSLLVTSPSQLGESPMSSLSFQ